MKILVTTGIFPPDVGGPARFIPNICNYLSKNNEVTVLTFSNNTSHSDFDFDYKLMRIPRNINKIRRFLKTLKSVLKEGKDVDLIFVNGLWFEVMLANFYLKKIIIRRFVGDPIWEKFYNNYKTNLNFEDFNNNKQKLFVELLKKIRNYSIKKCNKVIVPSDNLFNFIKKTGYENKIIKIVNGTSIEPEKSKLHQNKFLIVSRLVRHKNIDIVIKSFTKLKKHHNINFQLDILGDGPEKINLQKLIESLEMNNEIKLLGSKYDEELKKYYLNAKFFLQLSNYEGLPHTVLEAMSFGLVTIVSNVGGNNDIITNNLNGYIYNFQKNIDTIDDLTIYILNIISKDQENLKISRKAFDSIKENFSLNKTINKYIDELVVNE